LTKKKLSLWIKPNSMSWWKRKAQIEKFKGLDKFNNGLKFTFTQTKRKESKKMKHLLRKQKTGEKSWTRFLSGRNGRCPFENQIKRKRN
jgi:hypothetical protein